MTESRVEHTRFGSVAPFFVLKGRCWRVRSGVAVCRTGYDILAENGSAGMIKTKSDQIVTSEVV